MDKFIFADEKVNKQKKHLKPWKILIADDEKEIHTITKIVLSNFIYEDRKVEILDSYSKDETIEIIKNNEDIAVLLLDVVMDTDDAGLKAAREIREQLNNTLIRIILRTGQPGSAPEKDVISKYDINDYKEKTELTTTKLYTTVMTALRAYRDLQIIENNKIGLEKVLQSTNKIMGFKNSKLFASTVIAELTSLLELTKNSAIEDINIHGLLATVKDNDFIIESATGDFKEKDLSTVTTDKIRGHFNKALKEQKSYFDDKTYMGYFNNDDKINLIYIESNYTITENEQNLIDLFSTNVSVAFNNLHLTNEILDTQKEIIETLSEVVEKRSKETSNHTLRVAQVSKYLALQIGLDEIEADKIAMASPLHDIGKTGIADAILLKPGRLSPDEYNQMKLHTEIGRDILGTSNRPLLKAASIIAYQHHEKWDGSGYPNNTSGDNIHIYGRITAIADVFDALYHKRIYKDAWPLDQILNLIKEERGKHFDPNLVDIFLENIDEIVDIVRKFS